MELVVLLIAWEMCRKFHKFVKIRTNPGNRKYSFFLKHDIIKNQNNWNAKYECVCSYAYKLNSHTRREIKIKNLLVHFILRIRQFMEYIERISTFITLESLSYMMNIN